MFAKNVAQQSAAQEIKVLKPGEARRPAARKVALFVAHGMGQQVPFETMDAVSEGLRRIAGHKGNPARDPRAVTALVGSEENGGKDRKKLQRIELGLQDRQGAELEVHIYEGYWASVTEGQVTIRDVLSFLFRGGFNGVRNARRDFWRWMFGKPENFGRQRGTAFSLALALAVVASLVAVNFVVTVLFADRLAGSVGSPLGGGAQVADSVFAALTTLIAGWAAATFAIGVLLYAVHRLKGSDWAQEPESRSSALGPSADFLGFLLALWVLATLALGAVSLAAPLGLVNIDALGSPLFTEVNRYTAGTWIGLIGLSLAIRGLLIQYPGDVAAYISSHTLDRFQEIRSKIKQQVVESAAAIYAAEDYEGVVWVGHSLGSVVAYDALNAILVDDELAKGKRRAVERTKLLVTFGSPLDKIVFIFASQWAHSTGMRDALAASFQPLIQDYARFRGIPWINIHSPADIISGSLDFFDPPDATHPRKVVNLPDPDASTPLLAHVEYWDNRLLYEAIYAGLMRKPGEVLADAEPRAAASAKAA
jgi:hypothetical protein